jgi:hypothetical protein
VVVVADVDCGEQYEIERRRFGGNPEPLRLAGWLVEQEVEKVVAESTAQYWQLVWAGLEWQFSLGAVLICVDSLGQLD